MSMTFPARFAKQIFREYSPDSVIVRPEASREVNKWQSKAFSTQGLFDKSSCDR